MYFWYNNYRTLVQRIYKIMERKLNKQIADYISDFKAQIKKQALNLNFQEKDKLEQLLTSVFEHDRLVLSKEDVSKRKRIKNSIPSLNRCHAKRANGEQCTRKQKEGCTFCGTHAKGTPHGIIHNEQTQEQANTVVSEVFAEEIGGIVYYLDNQSNVFQAEDILNNKENPRVIAQYTLQNGTYHIPSLGI